MGMKETHKLLLDLRRQLDVMEFPNHEAKKKQ